MCQSLIIINPELNNRTFGLERFGVTPCLAADTAGSFHPTTADAITLRGPILTLASLVNAF